MTRRLTLSAEYPLRKFFRKALDFGFHENSTAKPRVGAYNEEQHLCEFILSDSLYKIKDAAGRPLEDVADLLAEGDVSLNARNINREFEVHKHIGDYALMNYPPLNCKNGPMLCSWQGECADISSM